MPQKNWKLSGSHHTKPPPSRNGCYSKNFCSNHSCFYIYSKWQMASTAFKYELCLSFCLILILQYDTRYEDTYKLLLSSQYVDFFGWRKEKCQKLAETEENLSFQPRKMSPIDPTQKGFFNKRKIIEYTSRWPKYCHSYRLFLEFYLFPHLTTSQKILLLRQYFGHLHSIIYL